jgi:hypothetical protein
MPVRLETSGSALDLLEREDLELRRLFSVLRQHRGTSVEDRADYGQAAKDVIRHIATREAALVEVAESLGGRPGLERVSAQMHDNFGRRRRHIDRVEKMSRGVQGINLNVGQDFDDELQELERIVGTEIEWELGEAIPQIQHAIGDKPDGDDQMKSAHYLQKHAPTNLEPSGPRWIERAPVVSRLLTVYDHLRDFPRGRARSRG